MIDISISKDANELGLCAAKKAAGLISQAISERGEARIILSTGMSQFETLKELVKMDVDWSKVTMFHLDEYVGLPETHIASFRKYLKERFSSLVDLKAAYFVNGEDDVSKNIEELSAALNEKPVDVGLIGIGENGHIAFNDPPADFETTQAYKIVDLDTRCRMQQVGEGWFATVDDVPRQAISMCPRQIISCRHIISAVPHKVKSQAVYDTITKPVSPMVPATLLKTHPDWSLFLDMDSASMLLGC